MTEQEKPDLAKRAAYAAFLVRVKGDHHEAGILTYPDDEYLAMRCAVEWRFDDFVIAEYERLLKEGQDLPGKIDLQRSLWDKLQGMQGDDYLKAAKLYAEISGFIEKPAAVQVNNTNKVVIPKMIQAPNFTPDEWQAQAAKQQKESLQNADTRH